MENNTEISFQEIIKEVLGQKLAGFLIFFVTYKLTFVNFNGSLQIAIDVL